MHMHMHMHMHILHIHTHIYIHMHILHIHISHIHTSILLRPPGSPTYYINTTHILHSLAMSPCTSRSGWMDGTHNGIADNVPVNVEAACVVG